MTNMKLRELVEDLFSKKLTRSSKSYYTKEEANQLLLSTFSEVFIVLNKHAPNKCEIEYEISQL